MKEKLDKDIGLNLIRTTLEKRKRIKLRFRGKSMEPSIKDGEKVFFEGISPDQIETGDIILFNNARSLIGHRVLWKLKLKKLYFLTKGDNSNFPDRPIHAGSVYGRVVRTRNRIIFYKVDFKVKLSFLLEIFLKKIEHVLSLNLNLFRSNLSRILYATLRE